MNSSNFPPEGNSGRTAIRTPFQWSLSVHKFRNFIAKFGLNIRPYYWVQEACEDCLEPKIKGDLSEFSLRELTENDIDWICDNDKEADPEELRALFRKGNLCLALEHETRIANYMFIELKDFIYLKKSFRLKKDEAFLQYMWTNPGFRGRSLAPYLRYQGYKLLDKLGRYKKYSATDFFNSSSIRFKKKLNSRHLRLYMFINLFKRLNFTVRLRNYA